MDKLKVCIWLLPSLTWLSLYRSPGSKPHKKGINAHTSRTQCSLVSTAVAQVPHDSWHIRVKSLTQGGRGSAEPLMCKLPLLWSRCVHVCPIFASLYHSLFLFPFVHVQVRAGMIMHLMSAKPNITTINVSCSGHWKWSLSVARKMGAGISCFGSAVVSLKKTSEVSRHLSPCILQLHPSSQHVAVV